MYSPCYFCTILWQRNKFHSVSTFLHVYHNYSQRFSIYSLNGLYWETCKLGYLGYIMTVSGALKEIALNMETCTPGQNCYSICNRHDFVVKLFGSWGWGGYPKSWELYVFSLNSSPSPASPPPPPRSNWFKIYC